MQKISTGTHPPDFSMKHILLRSSEFLQNKGIDNARYDAEQIISHILNIPRMDIYLQFDRELLATEADSIRTAIQQRGKRKPLQYILGFVDFYGCKIAVNENVLIPRSETEFMVDLIIKDMPSQAEHILDICTGSGAIAIALQKARPLITVAACDIYEKALQVAKANAEKNSVKIDLILSNLFQNIGQQKFDLIVSNPPYVSQDEYKSLQPEIYFEPEKALVAEAEGLFCINKIITEAKDWLKPDGYLYLEIGEKQAESIKKIVNKLPVAEFIVYKDLSDRDRIIRIKFNG